MGTKLVIEVSAGFSFPFLLGEVSEPGDREVLMDQQ